MIKRVFKSINWDEVLSWLLFQGPLILLIIIDTYKNTKFVHVWYTTVIIILNITVTYHSYKINKLEKILKEKNND